MRILRPGGPILVLTVVMGGLGYSFDADAQTIPSPYRFIEHTHDMGGIFGFAQERRGELGIGPGGGPIVGARYDIDLTGPIAAELNAYVISTDRVVYEVQQGVGLSRRGKAGMAVFIVDLRLRFTLTGGRTWHGLAPYISLGGGVAGNFAGASRELEIDLPLGERTSFGPSALGVGGVGARWIPGERLTFRAEWSLSAWKQGTPPAFFEVNQELGGITDSEWIGFGAFVVGASYRF